MGSGNSGRSFEVLLGWRLDVPDAVAGPSEFEESAPGQDPVDDGLREVGVVEDVRPGGQGLVGGEDHGAAPQVALVDDL